MDQNVYQTPESSLNDDPTQIEANNSELRLASRWLRLIASIVDGIIIMIPSFAVMYFLGWFANIANGIEPPLWQNLLLGAFGLIVYIAVNYISLNENGQTLGKKILNIKVVDLEGNKPSVSTLIFKRYFPLVVVGQVPIIGQLLTTINILFIFGKEKRCIHDQIAKTRVVVS